MKNDMPNYPDLLAFRDGGMRDGSRIFELADRFRYYSPMALVIVPAGFKTDGASIPRVFWGMFSPFDVYFPAAVIHDWLYAKQSLQIFTRRQCDMIFLSAMADLCAPLITRWTIYYTVRMFGSRHFKTNETTNCR